MKKAFIQMCKEIFPCPLREKGEGKLSFAQQTEKALVPQYLSALVPSKHAAFTLAEVLITLGVIGVVAALTLPTLISNHNKKVWAKGLAKAYSATSQACRMALAQDGVDSFWDTEIGSDLTNIGGHGYYHHIVSISLMKYYQNAEVLDASDFYGKLDHIRKYDGNIAVIVGLQNHLDYGLNFPSYTIFPRFKAPDNHYPNGAMYYIVDANGIRKKPNVVGQDVFLFVLDGDCSLLSADGSTHSHHSSHQVDVTNISHCSQHGDSYVQATNQGLSDRCFRKVMQDGWEIKY